MLTLSKDNQTYANYSLVNLDKFMSKLIEKALKNKNINLTFTDYKKSVNKSNPNNYLYNTVLTFDKHLDVFLINVLSINTKKKNSLTNKFSEKCTINLLKFGNSVQL